MPLLAMLGGARGYLALGIGAIAVVAWLYVGGLKSSLEDAERELERLGFKIAVHHANEAALESALEGQSAEVRKWKAESEERRQAAEVERERYLEEKVEAENRILYINRDTDAECVVAVKKVRKVLGL